MKQKTKNKIRKFFTDRIVALVGIVSLTLVLLASFAVGFNIKVSLFDALSIETHRIEEKAKTVEENVKKLIENKDYDTLHTFLKDNLAEPEKIENVPYEDFKQQMKEQQDHIKVIVPPKKSNEPGVQENMTLYIGEEEFLLKGSIDEVIEDVERDK